MASSESWPRSRNRRSRSAREGGTIKTAMASGSLLFYLPRALHVNLEHQKIGTFSSSLIHLRARRAVPVFAEDLSVLEELILGHFLLEFRFAL